MLQILEIMLYGKKWFNFLKLVSTLGHVSLLSLTCNSPKKIWGLGILPLPRMFRKLYICGFLMLRKISFLPSIPSWSWALLGKLLLNRRRPSSYGLASHVSWLFSSLQQTPTRNILFMLMLPHSSPMLETNTSECFPLPFPSTIT